MHAQVIPALKMSATDVAAFEKLLLEQGKAWVICSYLPFVLFGEVGAVIVGQKKGGEDDRYYVFRVHSSSNGIEYHGRFAAADRSKAVASRFEAAEEVAEIIFDNRRQ